MMGLKLDQEPQLVLTLGCGRQVHISARVENALELNQGKRGEGIQHRA